MHILQKLNQKAWMDGNVCTTLLKNTLLTFDFVITGYQGSPCKINGGGSERQFRRLQI